MHSEDLQNLLQGSIDDMQITQEFLLGFAILMEIPIITILLSRLLPARPNRIAQLATGSLLIFIQTWSLTVGNITLHYGFFSVVEIGLLVCILWQALRWKTEKTRRQAIS
ncbi:MAG: hypothetical protein OHK0039_06020 [Bacteroidia bacterium]